MTGVSRKKKRGFIVSFIIIRKVPIEKKTVAKKGWTFSVILTIITLDTLVVLPFFLFKKHLNL